MELRLLRFRTISLTGSHFHKCTQAGMGHLLVCDKKAAMSAKKIVLIVVGVLVLAGIVAGTIHSWAGQCDQGCDRQSGAPGPGLDRQRHRADQAEDLCQRRRDLLWADYAPLCEGGRPRQEGRGAGHGGERAAGGDRRRAAGHDRVEPYRRQQLSSPRRRRPTRISQQAKADLEQKKLDYKRAQALYQGPADRQAGLRQQEGGLRYGRRDAGPAAGGLRPGRGADAVAAGACEPGARQPALQLRCAGQDHQPRSVRRPRDQRAGARGRDGGRRHSERRRLDADDAGRHVGHHRRGEGRRDGHRQCRPWGSRSTSPSMPCRDGFSRAM